MPLRDPATRRSHAVIDIGSNSVRLVVYRVEGRANAPVLNEKVLAGLGRGQSASGRLHAGGVRRALDALARYRILVDAMAVDEIDVIATAAVRDATDRDAFIAAVKARTGFAVSVISGAEEGRLSALGVLSGAPQATGVIGDLGGSSLELVAIGPSGLSQGESWRIGPLAFGGAPDPLDIEAADALIAPALAQSAVLAGVDGGDFHAVGGVWRALARIDMSLRDYPLQVLHNYAIPRAQAIDLCAFLARQSRKSIERAAGSPGKRAETLAYAAHLLGSVLQVASFDQVVISAHGLREGLLLDRLAPEDRDQDPLVAGAMAMMANDWRGLDFGRRLFDWINPPFRDLPPLFPGGRGEVVRRAACLLADIGAVLHPDDRARIAFELVLRAPYPAASHQERVFLARALARRYTGSPDSIETDLVRRLLDEERIARADALGAAMRLAADLSGRAAGILSRSRLSHSNGRLVLSTEPALEGLLSEQAQKRLEQLGQALGTPVAVEITPP